MNKTKQSSEKRRKEGKREKKEREIELDASREKDRERQRKREMIRKALKCDFQFELNCQMKVLCLNAFN